MRNSASIILKLIVLRSLSHCETVGNTNVKWFSKKYDKNKVIRETMFQNKQHNILKPDRISQTDIQFYNIVRTFNNISYEKHLKFWAFSSHFNIYLKKQQLFHHTTTINDQPLNDTYMDIPSFFVGFIYDATLSVVHGRFHRKNFRGWFIRDNVTIEIRCPKVKNTNENHVYTCKVSTFKIRQLNITDDRNCPEINRQNMFAKALPHSWKRPKKNMRVQSRRHKRALRESTSCSIHIIADHLYFKHVGGMNYGSTVEAMMTSVSEADAIFRSTDFDGDGYGDNIGFIVGNITIYSDPHEPDYKLQDEDLTVHHYLNRFSEYDFSSYCLGVAFTYRDFENGVVGLAWVANSNPLGRSGGICEERVADTNNKPYSFNTLILSQFNGGAFYPSYTTALALTHELGHSFGSPHDNLDETFCTPNDEFGNYVMYPYVISGRRPNNRKFSPCSIQGMHPVIVKKGIQCLKADTGPICGNGIREDGEQCDCGTSGICQYVDPCCIPSDIKNSTDKPCTFGHNKTKTCSPKYSPCCSEECVPINSNKKRICRPETDCTRASYCDGASARCPFSVLLPDGTACNGGRKICESGLCLKSICEQLQLEDCQCDSKPLYCYLCCKEYSANKVTCEPVGTFAHAPNDSLNLRTQKGYRCNANKGYCDDKHVCVMERLDDIQMILHTFLSSGFQQDIVRWFRNYWSDIFGGFVIIMTIVVIFFITYRRNSDRHIEALRAAKLTTALSKTLRQKLIYVQRLENFENKIEQKINDIMLGERMDFTEAVGRLFLLFPTAPIPLILNIVKCSATEESAVRMLLIRGYPMKEMRVLVPKNSIHCLFQTDNMI